MKYKLSLLAVLCAGLLLDPCRNASAGSSADESAGITRYAERKKPPADPLDPAAANVLGNVMDTAAGLRLAGAGLSSGSANGLKAFLQGLAGTDSRSKKKARSAPLLQSAQTGKKELDPFDPGVKEKLSGPAKQRRVLDEMRSGKPGIKSSGPVEPKDDPFDQLLKEIQEKPANKVKPAPGSLANAPPARSSMLSAQGMNFRDRRALKDFLTELSGLRGQTKSKSSDLPQPAPAAAARKKPAGLAPSVLDRTLAKHFELKTSASKQKTLAGSASEGWNKTKSYSSVPLPAGVHGAKLIKAAADKSKLNNRTLLGSAALSATGIAYGDSVSGALSESDETDLISGTYADFYTFNGNAGAAVVIDLTTSDFDSYLYLYDPEGVLAAYNDDFITTSRSLINYILPSTGVYTIEVTSFELGETGNYLLKLDLGATRTVEEISWGDSLDRDLSMADGLSRLQSGALADDYNFTGGVGDIAVIDLSSGEFDTYLYLYDPSGELVADNDDYGDGSNSFIVYVLPEAGTYTVEVSSYAENETGQYRITLTNATDLFPERSSTEIVSGSDLDGSLGEGDGSSRERVGHFADDYTFAGAAGDQVLLDLTSAEFDTYLYLYGPDGELSAENDDYGSVSHSVIELTLPASGTYTVEVTSYESQETGGYRISFRSGTGIRPERSVTEITSGDMLAGSLGPGDGPSRTSNVYFADDWTFTAAAGTAVVIGLESDQFDAFLFLFGPDGELVAYNDDFGNSTNSFVSYQLPADGDYTIEVTSYSEGESGEYRITFQAGESVNPERSVTEIAYNDSLDGSLGVADGISRTGSGHFADDFTFTGNAGDSLSIDLSSIYFDTYLFLYDPDGNLVAENDDYGGTSRSYIWYRLNSSGTYTVEVSSYGGLIGEYRITLLANENAGAGRSATALSYGSALEGSLSFGDGISRLNTGSFADDYNFEGNRGDSVVIDLAGDEFEAMVFLYDPNGYLESFSGLFGDLSTTLISTTLFESGTYTIEVTSSAENATGAYNIRLILSNDTVSTERSVRAISFADSVAGSLNRLDGASRRRPGSFADDYTFEAGAGDVVAIGLSSDELDTYLYLYDPEDSLVAISDDYGSSSDSYIWQRLDAAGTYTVEATTYSDYETGAYLLVLSGNEDAGSGRSSAEISLGNPVDGTLDPSDGSSRLNGAKLADDYTFSGQTGDLVAIELLSSEFDAYLYLYDTGGGLVAENDDFGSTMRSVIIYELPSSGIYTIEVSVYEAGLTGSYRITLLDGNDLQNNRSVTGIAYGADHEGRLDTDDGTSRIRAGYFADDFIFSGLSGDSVLISAFSTDFDTYLHLYDSQGVLIARNDDFSAETSNSLIGLVLPAGGEYTVEVTSYGGGTGEYLLRLTSGEDIASGRSTAEIAENVQVNASLNELDGTSRERSGRFADDYTFAGVSGEPVLIEATSAMLDTYLYLYDQNDSLVAWNDDYGDISRSLISHLPASSGTYTIEVTSYDEFETGAYTLTLLKGQDASANRSITEISFGQEVEGSLEVSDGPSRMDTTGHFADDFIFSAASGDTVAVDLYSSDFDTFIYLYDPNGELVARNDDYGGISRSFLKYTATASGVYTVEVSSFFENETGGYRLKLLSNEAIEPERSERDISFGDEKSGSLDGSDGTSRRRIGLPADDFTFSGSSGDSVLVDLSSHDFDTYLYLFGPDGSLLAGNDDFGGTSRSLVKLALPASGKYTIEVTAYESGEAGDYQIVLLSGEDFNPQRSGVELFYGRSASGSLGATDGTSRSRTGSLADDYTFTGASGDSVIIDLSSDEFDTYLILFGPDGSQVARNDDFGSTSRSYIWHRLSSSGVYTIEVTTYSSHELGRYEITLLGNESVKPGRSSSAIAYGDSITGSLSVTDGISRLISGSFADDYTFTGNTGDSIAIELTSSAFDTYLFLLDSRGDVAAYNDDWGGISHSYIWYRLPADGTFTIEVASVEPNPAGTYLITLSSGLGSLSDNRSEFKIGYGEEVNDSLFITDLPSRRREGAFSDDYSFTGSSGDTVRMELTSNEFDTFLYLYGPGGALLAYNDDYQENISRSLIERTLQASGTYIIEVTSYESYESGRYKLALSRSASTVSVAGISYGLTLSGVLTEADTAGRSTAGGYADCYKFNAAPGDSVRIVMAGDGFETYLALYDGSGAQAALSGVRTPSSLATIAYRIAKGGDYTIEAGAARRGETGPYLLSLISPGAGFTPAETGDSFTFVRRGWGLDLSSISLFDKNLFSTGLPWSISLPYSQDDLHPAGDESQLRVMGYNAESGSWIQQKVISRDLENNSLTIEYTSYLVTIFAVLSGSEEVTVPGLSPASSVGEISPGGTYVLRIMAGYNYPVTELNDLSFAVTYDSLLVENVEARTAANVDTSSYVLTATRQAGKIDIKFAGTTGEGFFGSGTVVEITFRVLSTAPVGSTADFNIVDLDARNQKGETIPLKAQNTSLTIGSSPVSSGDVDGSGSTDIFDLLELLKVLSSGSPEPKADVDGNGNVDIFDVLALLMLLSSG